MKDILNFLGQLRMNNNREWFNDNRDLYQESRGKFEAIISKLIDNIALFDPSVADVKVKDCTYRINRDTRFSNDKAPYKCNFGAFISPGGKKAGTAGYYLHIEPDNSIVAGGIHMPPPDVLLKLRKAIFEKHKEFISIIENPDFVKTFGKLDGDKLTSAPRGFPKDFEHIDLLKFKSYTFISTITNEFVEQGDLENYTIDCFKKIKKFNSFLNKAVLNPTI